MGCFSSKQQENKDIHDSPRKKYGRSDFFPDNDWETQLRKLTKKDLDEISKLVNNEISKR